MLRILLAASLCAPAAAQDIDWVTFDRDDGAIDAPPQFGLNDIEEKDFAWADLDRDGWTDLVVVRKEENLKLGKRENILLMNEGGVLVDRTLEYATASDVAGDEGFLTRTADRDVVIIDIDGDGWDDVITAATLSLGDPKHISHPRVYRNLGGVPWQGLRFEDGRIPQFQVNGQDATPFFCGVGAGDVDGDGDNDLYFSDYSFFGQLDLEDRLLINDGAGYFTDESQSRLTMQMRNSSFGTRASIHDMNSDGVADIVKCMGTCQCTETVGNLVRVLYNDPDDEGQFEFMQEVVSGSPYFFSVGDLNQDELPDLVVTNDFSSHTFRLNQGNNPFGLVNWGPNRLLQQAQGVPFQGSAGNTLIADLDMDGWNDAIACDFEVSVGFCGWPRGTILYHNRGGTVGGPVDMVQEKGAGFISASGLTQSDMTGMHDVAVFDVDRDGDPDMILGSCQGLRVWKNEIFGGSTVGEQYCDSGINSGGTQGVLVATGSAAVADNDLTLRSSALPASVFGYMVLSSTTGNLPGFGGSQGVLCLGSPLVRFRSDVLLTSMEGTVNFQPDLLDLPEGTVVQPGEDWFFQLWYRDSNPTATSNTTAGLAISFE